MASGLNHIRASSYAAVPMGIITGLTLGIPVGVGITIGCLLGIPLTPELDQISISKSEWRLVKRFGPFGFIWCAYWWLYARLIPHRSFWSHFPVVGTAIRLLYLLIPIIIFCIWKDCIPDLSRISQVYWDLAWGALIGLLVSDFLHWVMDL